MEKRLLLFLISAIVVFQIWTIFNPPPKNKEQNPKVFDSQGFTVKKEDIPDLPKAVLTPSLPKNEEIYVLENDKIKAEFSNIGGTLKKLTIKEFNVVLPITKIFDIAQMENMAFNIGRSSANSIEFILTNDKGQISKSYELSNQGYLIDANVQSNSMSNLNINAFTADTSNIDPKILQSADRSLYEYSIALFNKIIRKGNAVEFNAKDSSIQSGEVSWMGFRDRYFAFVLKPKFKTEQAKLNIQDKKLISIELTPSDINAKSLSSVIYVGPQKLHLLSGYNQGFENIMVFSNWWILDVFAKMIYFFIHFLNTILHSWGISILLLAITIYLVTYPLTAKSMSSMRKMQAIQPKMKSLQDKHKNDPNKLNKEMMELFKEHGVNPYGGCLPMILQMPIFYGLYQVLWRSVEFKGTHFLWIKDLSMPDRLVTLNFNIPFLGNELNILPILMAIIMFFQQRYTSKSMVITDENQLMQQKMMGVMMPVMMGFIFYHFASGLCIYFTVFYLLSTLTQRKMSKMNAQQDNVQSDKVSK